MSQDLKNQGSGSTPPKSIPWGWIVAGLIVGFLFTFSVMKAFNVGGIVTYYLTANEFVDVKTDYLGRNVKIAGRVQEASLQKNQNVYRFIVEYQGKSFPVEYTGFAPDTFQEGSEVVIEGVVQDSEVFVASTLMAKCASKYEVGAMPSLENSMESNPY